ncbi:MAG TPA: lipocalin family protein [Hymenobacter sp.]
MTLVRISILSISLAFAGLSLASCKKDDPQPSTPAVTVQQQLATGSWRLDEIKQSGRVTSTTTGIKDRYSLTFRPNGTYTQTLLADNTTYNGTWMLMNSNTMLHLVDQKGTNNEYTLTNVTATQLRYTYPTKDGLLEERTFSAQP